MRRIAWVMAVLVAGLTALWFAATPWALPWATPGDIFAWRAPLLQGTGIVGMGLMSVGMVLSTRPMAFEPALGGLDKMYRLHRWLGITGASLALAHWLWVELPKWAVGLGWATRPARTPRELPADPLLLQLHAWRDAAEGVGEPAFYALMVLVGLALFRRFPYRHFFQTHRLLPLVYLVLVFHAVVLLQDSHWSAPVGGLLALLMAAGSVAAVVVGLGAVGRRRQALGRVDAVSLNTGLQVLAVSVHLHSRWPGHAAGQFAFVRFAGREAPHPFTISSGWTGDGRLDFLIKGLGDYTRALPTTLQVGDLVRVEGPYGCFDFAGTQPRQIWVGGGIGITPFIARLRSLALQPDGRHITLFHTSGVADEVAFARLRAAARAAGAELHVLVDAVDGRLNADRLCAAVPGWRAADVWFCGPAGFGRSLRHDLLARGLPARQFHQELFELR